VPDRAINDVATLHAILDAGLVAHVAVRDPEGQPYVVPVGYARMDDAVVFHGSTASRLFRTLADGQPTCLTVTLLDGVVLARSAFESSMNYRSVMVLGIARRITGDEELRALHRISEQLTPGRWEVARQPTPKQRAATLTLALNLDECSVKVRTGDPQDEPEDLVEAPYAQLWAGYVPLIEYFGDPVPDQHTAADQGTPAEVLSWSHRPWISTSP
jgi:nitroimidazol reductase NimA-like FMN-containing flavoprotein (pyridoxamine 5'-phosphate oxidase superfamily)